MTGEAAEATVVTEGRLAIRHAEREFVVLRDLRDLRG